MAFKIFRIGSEIIVDHCKEAKAISLQSTFCERLKSISIVKSDRQSPLRIPEVVPQNKKCSISFTQSYFTRIVMSKQTPLFDTSKPDTIILNSALNLKLRTGRDQSKWQNQELWRNFVQHFPRNFSLLIESR